MKCNKKHGKNNYIKFSSNSLQYNRSAFSLIELSVVLIIIGLLVAGITGGASLIESAKNRAFLSELNGYKQAFHTFYVSHGRLPGDINRDYPGLIGWVQKSNSYIFTVQSDYKAGDFAEPYDKVAVNSLVGPFVELYLDGLIDFKPAVGTGVELDTYLPYSKTYKSVYFYFMSVQSSPLATNGGDYLANLAPNSVYLHLFDFDAITRKKLPKPFKFIDEKTDDGNTGSGNVRASCSAKIPTGDYEGNVSYDAAIADKTDGLCDSLFYRVW